MITALVTNDDVDVTSIMLIGAHCRDLLHLAFGRNDHLRSTSDVDLALAVHGHTDYRRITSALPRSGSTGIRYTVAEITVDLIPFGEIEDPAGTTSLPDRTETINVFGFREVFDRSIPLTLPSGSPIRLPSPAGYAALKLKAWCDRSVNGEYKDAADIATLCDWYQRDTDIRASLFESEPDRTDLLIRAGMDVDTATLFLLGQAISNVLGKDRTAELARAWAHTDRGILAEYFARERSRARPDPIAAHRAITALTDFLARPSEAE
ncbi:hypothetical protein ACTD5D_07635 [Nocardia takedensis]|uniref:hypothetical protein n=1 Tax=Nocardia takedensis TaxID=259390 RepID=UPI003F7660EA